jgi:2-desacetyl-2-hydroxyethyl bacteriochlorophyllide A dehydrogenase
LVSTGTETLCLNGVFDPGTNWSEWVRYPFYPGYSMTGKVLKAGANVTGLREGDLVVGGVSHRQYFTVNAAGVLKVPDTVTAEDAAWMTLAITTQLGVRRAGLALGETVGVIGLGMLGQLVVQYLQLSGARKIVCIDPMESRLKLAEAGGATHLLATDAISARDEVAKITNGRMLDVVFDITGHPAVLAPATQLVRQLGRVILLGDTTTPSKQHLGPRIVSNSVAILGVHVSSATPHATDYNPWTSAEMASLFFEFLAQGRMNVARLVSHRLSPKEAPRLYERLNKERSSFMGVILDWEHLHA